MKPLLLRCLILLIVIGCSVGAAEQVKGLRKNEGSPLEVKAPNSGGEFDVDAWIAKRDKERYDQETEAILWRIRLVPPLVCTGLITLVSFFPLMRRWSKFVVLSISLGGVLGATFFAFGTWAFRESGKQRILSAGGDFHTTRARWEMAGFEQGKTWDGKPRWTTWRYDSDTEDWMVGWGLAGAAIGGMTSAALLVLNKRRRKFSKNLSESEAEGFARKLDA